MAYRQVHDVLDGIKAFHRRLGEMYHSMSEAADKERMKMLLDYMSRHEANAVECLDQFEKDDKTRVLESWFKSKTLDADLAGLDPGTLRPGMDIDDVIRVALEIDTKLLDFYRKMADAASSDAARDLFQALLKQEQKMETRMVRDAIEFTQDE